jgi:hypothetical protein
MLKDRIIEELQTRYPDTGFVTDANNNPFAILQNNCKEIGALEIYNDGDEVTISIREITHSHFNPYNEALSDSDRDNWIFEEVFDFLDALFDMRILFYRSPNRNTGGWVYTEEKVTTYDCERGMENFTWYGAITADKCEPGSGG